MKSIFKTFILFFSNCMIFFNISSCEKTNLGGQLTQTEYFAKLHTLEIQHAYFMTSLENNWDTLILPVGVKKDSILQNVNYRTYKIDLGHSKLCGDYIERRGRFSVEEFFVNGKIDSIVCQFIPFDSFGVAVSTNFIFFEGYMGFKILNATTYEVRSNLNMHFSSTLAVSLISKSLVHRILKSPVKKSFEDGLEFTGNSEIRDNLGQFNLSSIYKNLKKGVDAPNFPISGQIDTKSLDNNFININFDAFNNLAYDKLAKGHQGNTEWIFDIQ